MFTALPGLRCFGFRGLGLALWLALASTDACAQLVPSRSQERARGETTKTHEGQRAGAVSNGQPVRSGGEPAGSARDPYLSEFNQILSGSTRPLELHLIFPGADEISMQEVQFGAAISQALALRAGYRPVQVSRGDTPQGGKFNVLVGTAEGLSASLSQRERARIQHGYLSIRRLGSAPDELLLVVSGRTPENVADAIISLGLLRERFPDASYASIREVVMPESAPFVRRAPIAPGETYSFGQLREMGAVTDKPDAAGVTLELFVPGYLVTDSGELVSINLQHEQRQRAFGLSQSTHVSLNGQTLKPSRGTRTAGDAVEFQFPLNLLKPGRNVLQIGSGTGLQKNSPASLKVFESSTLTLPESNKQPSLPDLQLATRVFYPFVGDPSGKDISVVLGNLDRETVESAWTFLARLAQSANTFFFRSEYSVGELDSTRHNVVIGAFDTLPDDVRRSVALEAFREENANTPVSEIGQISRGTNLKMLIERWVKGPSPAVAVSQHKRPPDQKTPIADRWAVLTSAPSQQDKQLWNLVLTSHSISDLRDRTFDVIRPEYWDAIRGDIVLWGGSPKSMRVHIPGEVKARVENLRYVEFPTGDQMPMSIWVVSVLGGLLLFVITTVWVLGRFDEAVMLRQRKPR